jgi:hypothetical protein
LKVYTRKVNLIIQSEGVTKVQKGTYLVGNAGKRMDDYDSSALDKFFISLVNLQLERDVRTAVHQSYILYEVTTIDSDYTLNVCHSLTLI